MNLTEFFNSIRTYGDGSFSFPLLETFLTTPNNPDLTNFFDIYKQDNRLASSVDSKKYAQVIGKLLEDHKSYGGTLESITKAMQKNPEKMSISTFDVRNLQIKNERMHRFTINVSGTLLYDIVDKIYSLSKEMNYELDMEIPAVKHQKQGLTDTITIYSSNNNLFNTLDFIRSLEPLKLSFGEQSKYYAQVFDGVSYDSYNEKEEKWNRDLVGESIIGAIDNMIEDHISSNSDFYGEISTVNYKHNRVKMIRDIIDQGVDVYRSFNDHLQNYLVSKNVDPDDLFVSDNVYEKFFGPKVKVNDLFPDELRSLEELIEEATRKSLEEQTEEVPEENSDTLDINGESAIGDTSYVEENIVEDTNESKEKNAVLKKSQPILDPLAYLTPSPTASLILLDQLNKDFTESMKGSSGEKNENDGLTSLEENNFTSPTDEGNNGKEEQKDLEDAKNSTLAELGASFGNNVTTSEIQTLEKIEEESTPNEQIHVDEALIDGKDEQSEDVHVENVIANIFGDINLGTTDENLSDIPADDILLDGETPSDEISSDNNLLIDLIEGGEEKAEETGFVLVGTPREEESETLKALREFQEKRKKEIALMDEKARRELDRVQEEASISNKEAEIRAEELKKGNDYLEKLLASATEEKENLAVVSEEIIPKTVVKYVPKKTDEEEAMDEMLAALEQASSLPITREFVGEKSSISYNHEPTAEEKRLIELENNALAEENTGEKKVSVPIKRGDAEKYLSSVLENRENPDNTKEFDGFSEDMISEAGNNDLNPSDLFEAAVVSEKSKANPKSDVEKMFEARVAALNEKNKGKKSSKPQEKTEEVNITPEHARLNALLQEALIPIDRNKLEELKEDKELDGNEGLTPSSLFTVENSSSETYRTPPKEKSKLQEKYDAMLNGQYKEPPAVVIEKPAKTEVVVREQSAEEKKLDELLNNVGKEVQPVIQQEPIKLSEPVIREKTLEEQKMEEQLEQLAKVRENVEENSEFTGFDDTALDAGNYLSIVGSPDSMFSKAITEKYEEKKQGMSAHEDYLTKLLDDVYGPIDRDDNNGHEEVVEEDENTKEDLVDSEKEIPVEEQRLNALYEAAINGKNIPLIEEKRSIVSETKTIPVQISAEEQALEDLMKDATKQKEEPEFTGFDTDVVPFNNLELVSGNQGLAAASLEEKIKQVVQIELQKPKEEKKLDAMLRGEYKEETVVKVQEPEKVVAKKMEKTAAELQMDKQLAEMEEQSPSALFSVMNAGAEELGTKVEDEISPSSFFGGFDESMIDNSSIATSAAELFGEKLPLGVSQIMPQDEISEKNDNHFKEMVGLLGEEKNIEQEIEIPVKKEDVKVTEEANGQNLEFTGFETFFSDETSEEEQLNAAFGAISLLPLSSVELNVEEATSLLEMAGKDKYQFVGIDMKTKVIDEIGDETTLFDYLENNNVLGQLKPGEQIVTVWGSMTTEEFIRDKLVPNVIINGNVNFQEFMSQNVIDEYDDHINFGL